MHACRSTLEDPTFCFGAMVAFEMAQQLRKAGDEVVCLASFDGVAPRFVKRGGRPPAAGAAAPAPRGLDKIRRGLRYRWDTAVLRAQQMRIRMLRRYTERTGGPVPPALRRFKWYFPINSLLANQRYQPTQYPGEMTVFTIKGRYAEPKLGWGTWATGGVVAHEIQGELRRHRDLMKEPMIGAVAAILTRLMNGADGDDRGDAFDASDPRVADTRSADAVALTR